jgi:putative two-component system response regulator
VAERSRILIVDDNAMNVDILRRLLRKEYEIETFDNGEDALKRISVFRPDVVLLDIMMPGLNGYEVCQRIKESPIGELTQVILVSGKASTDERVKGYAVGADDYVVKPFEHDEMLSKVRVHCRLREAQLKLSRAKGELEIYSAQLERIVEERTAEVLAARDITVFALAELAESRDTDTGQHLIRIRAYSQCLAEELQAMDRPGYSVHDEFLADLYRASPLHDIGKVAIPDAILRKPGKLTDNEMDVMRQHVLHGAQTLDRAMDTGESGKFLAMAADVARFHHERWDGSGYCAGLRGDEIPLAARIVALADVFDALTSERVYKPPFPSTQARQMILDDRRTHFDPVIVDAFLACYPQFVEIRRAHGGAPEPQQEREPIEELVALI